VSAWLTSFAIGVVVAVPTAIGQLTGPLRHPPPEDRR
jgi:aryl-alcohol dehydrogenase-like predicted oxidoreductase